MSETGSSPPTRASLSISTLPCAVISRICTLYLYGDSTLHAGLFGFWPLSIVCYPKTQTACHETTLFPYTRQNKWRHQLSYAWSHFRSLFRRLEYFLLLDQTEYIASKLFTCGQKGRQFLNSCFAFKSLVNV